MNNFFATLGAVIMVSYAAGYLISVGLVNLLQFGWNLAFSTNLHYNVWGLGIVLYVVCLIFNRPSN